MEGNATLVLDCCHTVTACAERSANAPHALCATPFWCKRKEKAGQDFIALIAEKAFIAIRLLPQQCARAWNAGSSGCNQRVSAESQSAARTTAASDGEIGSVPQQCDASDVDRVSCLLQEGQSSANRATGCANCLAT